MQGQESMKRILTGPDDEMVTSMHQLLTLLDLNKLEKPLARKQITFAQLCELISIGITEERNGFIELLKLLSPYTYDVERCSILLKMKSLNEAKKLGEPTEEPFIEGLDEPEPDPLAVFSFLTRAPDAAPADAPTASA